jgi:O-acetyl-ADP-ribose deacetylase (regulator of RNase III)
MTLHVYEGDLLDQDVGVIVNAWNRNIIPRWLLLPQGVSGAIKRRAGYSLGLISRKPRYCLIHGPASDFSKTAACTECRVGKTCPGVDAAVSNALVPELSGIGSARIHGCDMGDDSIR